MLNYFLKGRKRLQNMGVFKGIEMKKAQKKAQEFTFCCQI
jgi:ribosomal protein L13